MASSLLLYALGHDLSPEAEKDFTSDRYVLMHFGHLNDKEFLDLGEGGYSEWMDDIYWATYRAPILDEQLRATLLAYVPGGSMTRADNGELDAFLYAHRGERIYGMWT
jgi:hypothetical protein